MPKVAKNGSLRDQHVRSYRPIGYQLDPGHHKGRPAMTSEAPEMNLVREWTTTSAPQRAGEMIMGLKVLSTTSFAPCAMHNGLVQTVSLWQGSSASFAV